VAELSAPNPGVWPDNVVSVNTFTTLASQWSRVGMSGQPCGLIYASIEPVLRLTRIPKKQWTEVFEDLTAMEEAALLQIAENQKE
jgi:hypothetical protein